MLPLPHINPATVSGFSDLTPTQGTQGAALRGKIKRVGRVIFSSEAVPF